MTWILVTISAYFLFAFVNLVDKYLLAGRIPSPKVYAFYTGALGILILVLVPFGFLTIPRISLIILALLAGAFHILGVFIFFIGLKNFEASRIMPALGALLPIFTFGLSIALTGEKEALVWSDILALILLISGTILITWQKEKTITAKSIKIALFSAFFLALYYLLAKITYLEQPFISGFIWTRIGAFILALFFLFSKEVKEDIFYPKIFQRKTWLIFIPNEIASASGFILQNWAVALAPFIYLGIINALEGIKFVFVLMFVTLFSLASPFWAKRTGLKEEISKEILFQKILAILLIGLGLATLALK